MLLYIVGTIVALFLLGLIAFPDRFAWQRTEKRKKVGATYWGIYVDQPTEEPEEMRTIEVVSRKQKDTVVAGSTRYATGKGMSFRM